MMQQHAATPRPARFENARCVAMALSALGSLVGAFWMAGILF